MGPPARRLVYDPLAVYSRTDCILKYRNVFVFSDSFAMLAEGSKGDRLVDEQPELVLPLEVDHHLQGTHLAGVHVDGFDD